jgi:hypothetical protein
VDAVAFLDRIDGDYVGMMEVRKRLGFGDENARVDRDRVPFRRNTLSATSRPSFVSVARYTYPMPPAPSDVWIS